MKLFKRHPKELTITRRHAHTAADGAFDNAFQKGRTITGGVSYEPDGSKKASTLPYSDRLHLHALKKRRRRIGGIFTVVIVATASIFILTSQFTAQAVVVSASDSSMPLDDVYARSIEAYMADNLREHWRFFLNTDALTEYLQVGTPEIKSVALRGSAGFGRSLFEVTFRQPIASWAINDKQLYVDNAGVSFSKNYFNPPALSVTDQNTGTASSGQSVASTRFLGFVGQVINSVTSRGYTAVEVIIPRNTTRQIEMKLTGVEYPIRLSVDRDAREGVDDTVKAIEWFQSKGINPQYIDLRVRGRVFYRE